MAVELGVEDEALVGCQFADLGGESVELFAL